MFVELTHCIEPLRKIHFFFPKEEMRLGWELSNQEKFINLLNVSTTKVQLAVDSKLAS